MNSSPVEPVGSAALLLTDTARRLLALGRSDLARDVARLALATDPGFADAHAVMAGVLDATGRFARALCHWREAARLQPGEPRQQVNLALAVLGAGDWENGLPLYEARLESADWSTMAARPSLDTMRARRATPETDLSGRHVMVVTEQGLGDSIWAARFLAPLAERCRTLTLATSAALRPLLARVDGAGNVIAPPTEQREARINLNASEAACDIIVSMMSLPWLLGVRPDDAARFPAPYLSPDAGAIEVWRERYRRALPDARRIIGLIWRANPKGPAAVLRSIPVNDLAPLTAVADAGFVILQGDEKRVRMEARTALPGAVDGFAGGPEPPPLDDFAAAIAATDLLVSIDTMGAHLAGAIGHPAIVLLPTAPSFCGLFWRNEGDRSGWYPSLRLVRQNHYGHWVDAVAEAAAVLKGDAAP